MNPATNDQVAELATENPNKALILELMTAVGELFVAMGRPAFTHQTPVAGIVETLREATRRFQECQVLTESELGQRIRQLEMEKADLQHALAAKNALASKQGAALVERSHQAEPPAEVQQAAREVAKWLNERPNRELDLSEVAVLANYALR